MTAVDTGTPPGYQWPDAGQAAAATAGDPPGSIELGGEPTPGNQRAVGIEIASIQLGLDGKPVAQAPNQEGDIVDPERGRIQTSYDIGEGFDATATIDLVLRMAIRSLGDGLEASTVTMSRLEGAPTDFEDVAPAGEGLVALRPSPGAVAQAFLELLYQVHMVAISEIGEHRDVRFQDIVIRRTADGFEVELLGGQAEPGEGLVLFGLEIAHDFRGFYSSAPQTLGLIHASGFETGDLSEWTLPGG